MTLGVMTMTQGQHSKVNFAGGLHFLVLAPGDEIVS